jgi:hypothetical protein
MSVTAETRKSIIQLVVTANNAAPGTDLLNELVAAYSEGASLHDLAVHLTASEGFIAKYPIFQSATEFGTEFIDNLVPEASAEAKLEGVSIIEGMLNAGSTRADVLIEAMTYLANQSEDHPAFGTSAALFNNRVEVATAHTVTHERNANMEAALSGVTSDDATVTAGIAAQAGGYASIADKAAADKAAADAAAAEAAAKAAAEKAAADAAAAAKAAEEKAAADAAAAAAAAEKALEDAYAAAAADAATAIAASEASDAALATAKAASEAAAVTAAETDADATGAA